MIVDIIYIYTPLRNNDCIHAYIHIILLCDYTVLHPHVLMVLSPAILMAPDGVKGSPAIPVGKAQCTLVDPGNTCESGIFHLFRAGKSTVHGQKNRTSSNFFSKSYWFHFQLWSTEGKENTVANRLPFVMIKPSWFGGLSDWDHSWLHQLLWCSLEDPGLDQW